MHRLAHRVKAQPRHAAAAMGSAHPAIPGPMTEPVSEVVTAPDPYGWVTVGYREAVPLFTADGAVIPGVPPGTWGQLRAAGRP